MRPLLALALACVAAACGSSAPTTPTPAPTTTTWTLSGTVSSSAGGGINAAMVTILDGPDLGKQTTSDAGGRYSFAGLHQAGFSVRASANGYTAVARGVTLTANTVADFQLPRLPLAALTFEGDVVFTARPDGGFDLSATGVNSGDGCASSISGTTTVTGSSGTVLTFPWSLQPTLIVRPGDRFSYMFGPISRADVTQVGSGGTYITRFAFTSVPCQ